MFCNGFGNFEMLKLFIRWRKLLEIMKIRKLKFIIQKTVENFPEIPLKIQIKIKGQKAKRKSSRDVINKKFPG